jgi:hypothetical protein
MGSSSVCPESEKNIFFHRNFPYEFSPFLTMVWMMRAKKVLLIVGAKSQQIAFGSKFCPFKFHIVTTPSANG